jgi:DNA-binding MarR family transcriptional regulator
LRKIFFSAKVRSMANTYQLGALVRRYRAAREAQADANAAIKSTARTIARALKRSGVPTKEIAAKLAVTRQAVEAWLRP